MINSLGQITLWVIAIALLAALPISELARSMSSNPQQHKVSRNAAIVSLIGLLMALWLFMYN